MASNSSPGIAAQPQQGLLLTVESPNGDTTEVRVDRSPFRIGRLPDCDLALRDNRISRNHAQILLEDGVYFIEDLKSRHGLAVNAQKTDRTRLRVGDEVTFGVDDSFRLKVGRNRTSSAPLLNKVASMTVAPDRTGNLGRLSAVLDVARALESSSSVDDVLEAAVDAALTVTGADRAFLMLQGNADDDGQSQLEVRVARDNAGNTIEASELRVPRSLIAKALESRQDLFTMSIDPNLGDGSSPTFDPGQTVVALELRSVLCVPLVRIRIGQQQETSMLSAKNDTLGALYMDTRDPTASLAEGNREVLQTLAIEISTVLENARLLGEQREKQRLEQELQIARDIQQALLPAELPTSGWLVAAGHSEACFQVGGDYYDVMQITPDHWGAVLADVSGKGVAAALLTSLLQGAFFSGAGPDTTIVEVITRINRYICERSRNARFATAFALTIERDGRMNWVNAGHCATLLVRADGTSEWLQPSGYPIGLFAEAEFVESECRLTKGDRLVLYSDGVSEANNWSREQFGEQRLGRVAADHRSKDALGLYQALLDEIHEFTQGAQQKDDLTLLVLGYEG